MNPNPLYANLLSPNREPVAGAQFSLIRAGRAMLSVQAIVGRFLSWVAVLFVWHASVSQGQTTLGDAIDAPNLNAVSDPSGVLWNFQTKVNHDGKDAASARIDGSKGGRASLGVEIQGPGVLSFWWKLDTSKNTFGSSPLNVGIGETPGAVSIQKSYAASSTNLVGAWQKVILSIPPQLHKIWWNLSSGFATNHPSLTGYVDQVSYTPASLRIVDSINSSPSGISRSEWAARYYKRLLEIPDDGNHPAKDGSGRSADRQQSGPVWLAAGDWVGENATIRQVTVPGDKYLLFEAWGNECSTLESPPYFGADGPSLVTCVQSFTPPPTLFFEIDGLSVPNINSYRVTSSPFSFHLPVANVFGLPGNKDGLSVADGIQVMIRPLATGDHVFRFGDASDTITYQVSVQPVLTGPPIISVEPADVVVAFGQSAQMSVEVSGTQPFQFQWFLDGNPIQDQTNSVLSVSNSTHKDAGTYKVKITNSEGEVLSDEAHLRILDPEIITQPASVEASLGQSAAFEVKVNGTQPLNYQWWKNKVALDQATNPILSIASVQTTDLGDYFVVIHNAFGSVTSSVVSLTVRIGDAVDAPELPWTQLPAAAAWAYQENVSHDGKNAASVRLTKAGSSTLSTTIEGPGVLSFWWKADRSSLNGNALMGFDMATRPFLLLPRYSYNIGAGLRGEWQLISVGIPAGSQGVSWTVENPVNGSAQTVTGYLDQVTFTPAAPMSTLTDILLQPEGKSRAEWAALYYKRLLETPDDGQHPAKDKTGAFAGRNQDGPVWFGAGDFNGEAITVRSVTVPADKMLFFDISGNECSTLEHEPYFGSNPDELAACAEQFRLAPTPFLEIDGILLTNIGDYRVTSPLYSFDLPQHNVLGLPRVASGLSIANGIEVLITPLAVGNHAIRFGDYNSDWIIYQITVPPLTNSAPGILVHPRSVAVRSGGETNLYAVVTGSLPLYFQWEWNGQIIPGATNSTLPFADFHSNQVGSYRLVVSNEFGRILSESATVGLLDPFFLSQPQSLDKRLGETAQFSVVVSSDSDVSYQWLKDGQPIPDATNASLVLKFLKAADIGDYQAVATSTHGSASSAVASLAVNLATVDLSFNPGQESSTWASSLTPDGRIFAYGGFSRIGGGPSIQFGLLFRDGTLDSGFQFGNYQIFGSPLFTSSWIQPDGKIILSGNFSVSTSEGTSRPFLARVNADGSLDEDFNPDVDGIVNAIAIQNNGKILIGGAFTTVRGVTSLCLARLNPDGTRDESFTPNLGRRGGSVSRLAVQEDGKILFAGFLDTVDETAALPLMRLDTNGRLDPTFKTVDLYQPPSVIVQQPDGKILIAGNFQTAGPKPRAYFARLNTNGLFDPTFNVELDQPPSSLALQADGKILLGGRFSRVGTYVRRGIARLLPNGDVDRNYAVDASDVDSIVIQPDGRTIVVGEFGEFGGVPRIGIARVNKTEVASESLDVEGTDIRWMRGGSSPEVSWVEFEHSSDGVHWRNIGRGGRIVGGWQLSHANFPEGGTLRARGYVYGMGLYLSSTWCIQSSHGQPLFEPSPHSVQVKPGEKVTFSGFALGSEPIAYQWWFNKTNALSGATNAMLRLLNAQTLNEGNYNVVASNVFGVATSRVAQLSLFVRPTIVTPPQSRTNLLGTIASFKVVVTNTATLPITYRWRKGQTLLQEQTLNEYSSAFYITNVAQSDAGTYSVALSNIVTGTITSFPVTLKVSKSDVPPTVSLTSPETGASYAAPAQIEFAANAEDPDGIIDHVEFYANATYLGSANQAPYHFSWRNAPAGNYQLTVKAVDNLGASSLSTATSIKVISVGLTSPGEVIGGVPYSEWPQRWWQWLYANPTSQSPALDTSGSLAHVGQSGPVYYLAGTRGHQPVVRNIIVPSGKYLFLPLINVLQNYRCPGSSVEPPEGISKEAFLAGLAGEIIDTVTNLSAELDGRSISDLTPFRQRSPLFRFTADPSWGALDSCSTNRPFSEGVTDGYWLMMEPLSAGPHTFHFRAQDFVPGTNAEGLPILVPLEEQDLTYHITVLPNEISTPFENVAGRSQAEWSATWWQWALSQPTNHQPLLDVTGADANAGQYHEVFFLGPIYGTENRPYSVSRTFSVPFGKPLFFPVLSSTADNVDVDPPLSIAQLRDLISPSYDSATDLFVAIDGQRLSDLSAFRQKSPAFGLALPQGNLLQGLSSGYQDGAVVDPLVADGYFVSVGNLSPGAHTLVYGGKLPSGFESLVTNLIQVELPQIVPPDQTYLGKTYAQWSTNWWQWAVKFPIQSSPLFDYYGSFGAQGQTGDVWFLASVERDSAQRSLVIPYGKSLFFPMVQVLADYPCPDPSFKPLPGENLEGFLTRVALSITDESKSLVDNLRAELDGQPIPNIKNYRATSRLFRFNADASLANGFDACITGNQQSGVSDGYWLMMEPLSVGSHVLKFKSEGDNGFSIDVQYQLTILPPGVVAPKQRVGSLTQEQWSALWWGWAAKQPENSNPLLDPNGLRANNLQSGSCFFLATPFEGLKTPSVSEVTHEFFVPSGKYLFMPMLSAERDNTIYEPDLGVDQLRSEAAKQVGDPLSLVGTLDGIRIPNLPAFRVLSSPFNFTLPTNNIFSELDSRYVDNLAVKGAVADGYWIMLEPPAVGTHWIHYGGTTTNGLQTHVTAYVHVLPSGTPFITRVQSTSTQIIVNYWTGPSGTYTVESSANLEGPWTSDGTFVTGNGEQRTATFSTGSDHRFFRIVQR